MKKIFGGIIICVLLGVCVAGILANTERTIVTEYELPSKTVFETEEVPLLDILIEDVKSMF